MPFLAPLLAKEGLGEVPLLCTERVDGDGSSLLRVSLSSIVERTSPTNTRSNEHGRFYRFCRIGLPPGVAGGYRQVLAPDQIPKRCRLYDRSRLRYTTVRNSAIRPCAARLYDRSRLGYTTVRDSAIRPCAAHRRAGIRRRRFGLQPRVAAKRLPWDHGQTRKQPQRGCVMVATYYASIAVRSLCPFDLLH